MKISPARTAAYDILFRIETEQAFSSPLLAKYESELSPSDRGLCHEITLGVLRSQIHLDRVIDVLTSGKSIDIEVRISLRLAMYQIDQLDRVPDHAAINESVNLVQRAKKTSAKGFVNAVLRRLVRQPVELQYIDPLDRLSVETSHPRLLLEKWIDEFGTANAEAFARSNNEAPAIAFRVIGEVDDSLGELLRCSHQSRWVEGCYLTDRYSSKLLKLAEKKQIYLQDESSQMVANAIRVNDGGRILDVCASPGGKVTLIAARNLFSGVIAAGDLHWHRVAYLRTNCAQVVGEKVSVLQYNAESGLPFAEECFDSVLVDAPCSGTGTIRHNPELRYRLRSRDIQELRSKQLSILKNASKLVRPGGTLVYSTCSVELEENEEVCNSFLRGAKEFKKIRPNVDDHFVTGEGFARTWPQRDGMDGFFIAAFQR